MVASALKLFICDFSNVLTWNSLSSSVSLFSVYGVEVLLKLSGLGPVAYFSSGWNLWVKARCGANPNVTFMKPKILTIFDKHCDLQCLDQVSMVSLVPVAKTICLLRSSTRFDFSVTVFAFLGLIALAFDMEPFYFIVVLRALQLLRYAPVQWNEFSTLTGTCCSLLWPWSLVSLCRLFKIKQRYRNVLDTMFELFPRMASLGLTLIIFYYSFAIVGMEFFADVVYPNCCK